MIKQSSTLFSSDPFQLDDKSKEWLIQRRKALFEILENERKREVSIHNKYGLIILNNNQPISLYAKSSNNELNSRNLSKEKETSEFMDQKEHRELVNDGMKEDLPINYSNLSKTKQEVQKESIGSQSQIEEKVKEVFDTSRRSVLSVSILNKPSQPQPIANAEICKTDKASKPKLIIKFRENVLNSPKTINTNKPILQSSTNIPIIHSHNSIHKDVEYEMKVNQLYDFELNEKKIQNFKTNDQEMISNHVKFCKCEESTKRSSCEKGKDLLDLKFLNDLEEDDDIIVLGVYDNKKPKKTKSKTSKFSIKSNKAQSMSNNSSDSDDIKMIKIRKIRKNKHYEKVATFRTRQDAVKYLNGRQEFQRCYSSTSKTNKGIKLYYKCNASKNKNITCSAGCYLYLRSDEDIVEFYQTICIHDHKEKLKYMNRNG